MRAGYYQAHRDAQLASSARRRDANRARSLEYGKAYYQAHKAERLAYQASYREKHREELNAARRADYQALKDAAAELGLTVSEMRIAQKNGLAP